MSMRRLISCQSVLVQWWPIRRFGVTSSIDPSNAMLLGYKILL
jgi:hypothetical protein